MSENHYKWLGLYDDASAISTAPATIARSVRMEDDAAFTDNAAPIQRRNTAGASRTHSPSLRGQQAATISCNAALAPAATAGVLPCIVDHMVPAGFKTAWLSVMVASAAVIAEAGDVISEAASSPTKTGVVAFVSGKIIWYLPDAGTFAASDPIFIEGVDTTKTVAAVTAQGAVEVQLDSRSTAKKQVVIIRDGNIQDIRSAVPTYSFSADQSTARIMQAVEYQGRIGTLIGAASDPEVTYPDAEDLQFADAVTTIHRVTSADTLSSSDPTNPLVVTAFGFNSGGDVQLRPDAAQSGGIRGARVANRGDCQLTMTIEELPFAAWNPFADKGGQQLVITSNIRNRAIIIGRGQLQEAQLAEANGLNTVQLTFDLNDTHGNHDTEFRMILTSEDVAAAAEVL